MPEAFALREWHVLVHNLSLVFTASRHEERSSKLKAWTKRYHINTSPIDESKSPVM